MDFKNDDNSPHKTNYHRQAEYGREWHRRDREQNPEKYAAQAAQRKANYVSAVVPGEMNANGEITHTEAWARQEAADLAAHPKPQGPPTRTRKGHMNPDAWRLFCERARQRRKSVVY